MAKAKTANSQQTPELKVRYKTKRMLDILSVVFQTLVLVVAIIALGPLG